MALTVARAVPDDLSEASMKTLTTLCTTLLATGACAVSSERTWADSLYKTSFECAQASLMVEKLICRDPQLARMDLELYRLYRLALTDERSVPRPDKVMTDQRYWTLDRNQCASTAEPKACIRQAYAERAHQLRQGSAIVRTKDPSRLTDGPLAFHCNGLDALVAATYFKAGPDVLYLRWATTSITLSQVPSDSGERYSGQDARGSYSFSQNGNQALLQRPASAPLSCTLEPTG
ncbi:MliC domain-containing protein [Pseudomonas sp. IT-P176]